MKTFITGELNEMQAALHEIETTSENMLQAAERSCLKVQQHLLRLKEYILSYEFRDTAEEISFFKEIKPRFLKELIYHTEVFYIEAKKPFGDTETMTRYYKQFTDRINQFFERNHAIYIYYKMGKSDNDETCFVRNTARTPVQPEYALDIDPKFSTLYSFKFSKIQAFERLNEFIHRSLRKLENEAVGTDVPELSHISLPWTDKKAGLIEILYGIQCMGSLNNAKAELKQIARLFEMAFNIDLGNYSRVFQEIRIRKKGRTAFLDRMKEMLIKRMDETDEYY